MKRIFMLSLALSLSSFVYGASVQRVLRRVIPSLQGVKGATQSQGALLEQVAQLQGSDKHTDLIKILYRGHNGVMGYHHNMTWPSSGPVTCFNRQFFNPESKCDYPALYATTLEGFDFGLDCISSLTLLLT